MIVVLHLLIIRLVITAWHIKKRTLVLFCTSGAFYVMFYVKLFGFAYLQIPVVRFLPCSCIFGQIFFQIV